MKFRMLTIIAMVFLPFNAAAFGANSNIDGRWSGETGSYHVPGVNMDYIFKAYGNFLTGTSIGGSNNGQIPILNGRIDGGKVSFTIATVVSVLLRSSQTPVVVGDLKVDFTGEISGDKLKLKYIVNDNKKNSGSFTVRRKKGKKDSSHLVQQDFDYESERRRAFELMSPNNYNLLEARPIFEKLHDANPDDAEVLEALALATMATVTTEKVPVKQRIIRLQARAMAERAKELGQNGVLIQQLIEMVCTDGTIATVTANPPSPTMETLREAEATFHSGKMEQAIALYERAAQLDPTLYEIPLFTGDAYYAMKNKDKAYEYYARAAAINPDRETAYRYWGDVLMSENRFDEAKEKLIESIISEPYSRLSWQFLTSWAERSKTEIGHPRIEITGNTVQINADSANKGIYSAWTLYGLSRAAWRMDNDKAFFESFPNEKEYRHSLAEEFRAFSAVAESVRIQLEDGSIRESDLDESIANLLELHRDGLLEAYILLARADDGIARDYPEYRKSNRDKLRRYLNEYVTAGK